MPKTADKTGFFWIGKHYGFPECCINDFIKRYLAGGDASTITKLQDKHCAHGFIPCQKCAKKIERGETTLAGLITDRKHETPFPHARNNPLSMKTLFICLILIVWSMAAAGQSQFAAHPSFGPGYKASFAPPHAPEVHHFKMPSLGVVIPFTLYHQRSRIAAYTSRWRRHHSK